MRNAHRLASRPCWRARTDRRAPCCLSVRPAGDAHSIRQSNEFAACRCSVLYPYVYYSSCTVRCSQCSNFSRTLALSLKCEYWASIGVRLYEAEAEAQEEKRRYHRTIAPVPWRRAQPLSRCLWALRLGYRTRSCTWPHEPVSKHVHIQSAVARNEAIIIVCFSYRVSCSHAWHASMLFETALTSIEQF